MTQKTKIAAVQMDIVLKDVDGNLARIKDRLRTAANKGAQIVVFPECAVTGYCFESLEEAMPFGQSVPGPATEMMVAWCAELEVHAVVGLLECDGDQLYNVAVSVGPAGLVAKYRKVHLPHLGVDNFTTGGTDGWSVEKAGDVQVGMHICYDSAFPEAARTMALDGADLLVLPTNFPPGAECMVDHVTHARAMENCVYLAVANRCGEERGFKFIGQSKICGPDGELLAYADHTEEEILYATIDPAKARNKRRVRVPGKHEIDRFEDREPNLYGRLVK